MSLEQVLNSPSKWIIINIPEVETTDKTIYNEILALSAYTHKGVLNTSRFHFHQLLNEAMLHTFKTGVAIDFEIEKIFANHDLYTLLNGSDNYLDWFITLVTKHYDYLYAELEDSLKLTNFKVIKVSNGWDLNTYGLLIRHNRVLTNDTTSNSN